MARLTSIPPFTGTRDSITIYWMFGKPFMRSRSSLTGKRVKTDPAFYNTMKYAELMAKGSPIASFGLRAWRRRDKEFRREYYKEIRADNYTYNPTLALLNNKLTLQ